MRYKALSARFTSIRASLGIATIAIVGLGLLSWHTFHQSAHASGSASHEPGLSLVSNKSAQPLATTHTPQTTAKALASAGPCSSNTIDKAVIISISKRHLWGCEQTSSVYDSPVVTGMENIAADLTPTGTYHIYGKQTNLYLKGSDSTGSWNDYVSYWMPFLHNQYGTYGFHDATWRADGDFGNIDPYSDKGSHGCVELPLATAEWLYSWASIGTTVIIQK